MKGYWGKIAEVDLSNRRIEFKEIEYDVLKKYIGGRGLGAYLYTKYVPEIDVDPMTEKNPIIIATGPLTGTPASTAGRISATTRSPLTGTILDSNAGGMFGAPFKYSGIDAMVIIGKSEKPVYIFINNDQISIEDAGELWGKGTGETTKILKAKHKAMSVISIGPAAENGVLYASVMVDGDRGFGRGGLGTVWALKNLKAIAVRGTKRPEIHSPEDFKNVHYEIIKLLKAHPITSKTLPAHGTNALMKVIDFFGMLPTKNFQKGQFEGTPKVDGEAVSKKILIKPEGCWGCPIVCGRRTRITDASGHGPEYETAWALGPNLMIDDLEAITKANYLCNEYGMDTITFGGTLAYAMEATEKGIRDFGIRFGDAEKLVEYARMTALKEGIGAELALGSKRLAQKYGGEDFAMNVKGLELPAYDPRGSFGMALVYSTSNRGACHLRGGYSVAYEELGVPRRINRFATAGKGTHVARSQDIGAFYDSSVLCRFTSFAVSMDNWARLVSAVLGETFTAADLEKAGERIHNLERLINLKLGFSKKDDTLPRRLLKEALKEGPSKGRMIPFDDLLKEYYEYRGWDENGVPTPEKIKELGLEDDVKWL